MGSTLILDRSDLPLPWNPLPWNGYGSGGPDQYYID